MNNSIPLILASKSKPRRDVLFSAGICPTIRVSNVDEPAALEREAAAMGVAVSDLSVEQRVMILATAKAEAVHQAYRNVAATAAAAHGDRVVGFPLKAVAESSNIRIMLKILGIPASLEHHRVTLRADEVQSASDVRPAIFRESPFLRSPNRLLISLMASRA